MNKKKKQNKGIPLCKCGHLSMDHLPSAYDLHHCKKSGCECDKWEFSGKYEKCQDAHKDATEEKHG